MRLLKLLGKLGTRLPALKSKEWDSIFEFIDYFMVVSDEIPPSFANVDWTKAKEILSLLGKIQD